MLKFDKELIIYYKIKETKFTKIYKRIINKLDNEGFVVFTYYKGNNELIGYTCQEFNYNKEQIEELIKDYLSEFECEKVEFN